MCVVGAERLTVSDICFCVHVLVSLCQAHRSNGDDGGDDLPPQGADAHTPAEMTHCVFVMEVLRSGGCHAKCCVAVLEDIVHENMLFGHLPLHLPVCRPRRPPRHMIMPLPRTSSGIAQSSVRKRSKSGSAMFEKSCCPLSSPKSALTWSSSSFFVSHRSSCLITTSIPDACETLPSSRSPGPRSLSHVGVAIRPLALGAR